MLSRATTRLGARPAAALAASIALACGPATAAGPGLTLAIGVEAGGDDVVELEFDGGGTERIDAGDATFVELELTDPSVRRVLPDAPAGLLTALTLGYGSAAIDAFNGDVTYSRVSLGLHQHFRFAERFRIGAGAIWQPYAELDTDVDGVAGGDADFEHAFGLRLSADWTVARRLTLGLRATFMDQEFDGGPEDGRRVDGDSVGLSVGVRPALIDRPGASRRSAVAPQPLHLPQHRRGPPPARSCRDRRSPPRPHRVRNSWSRFRDHPAAHHLDVLAARLAASAPISSGTSVR